MGSNTASNDQPILEQLNAIAEELRDFRSSVERRIETIERKSTKVTNQALSLETDGTKEHEIIQELSLGRKRVRINEGYRLSEDVVEAIEQLLHKIRRSRSTQKRKRLTKSAVVELLLRIGLKEVEDDQKRNKYIQSFLGELT
ncbi:MAG: hypothetical protein ACLGJB_15835 [Blastocatellia bacterium]